VEAVQIQYLVR
jgi:hypothetical protein